MVWRHISYDSYLHTWPALVALWAILLGYNAHWPCGRQPMEVWGSNNNNNNNNKHDNVYGAVIMAEPLREFTRFI